MIKKSLSLLLCALLALLCAAAAAEDVQDIGTINVNGAYKLTARLPEGYRLEFLDEGEGYLRGSLTSEDPAKPFMYFSIAWDETYSEVERMNDMPEADLANLAATFPEGSEISYGETTEGTKLMIVHAAESGTEYMTVLTVYKGYMVEFDLFAGPDGHLSEEQKNLAVAFLSDMQFLPVELSQ